jgi:tetratricopeptide (TPR) repeat protein
MTSTHTFTRWLPALAAVAATLSGCSQMPGSATKQIREGHLAYNQNQFELSERRLTPIIEQYPDAPETAEALYVRGLARVCRNKSSAAKSDFQAALRLAERPELRTLIQAQLGNLEYEASNYASAVNYYRLCSEDLADRPPSDQILLRYGVSLQRAGDFREGRKVLADLLMRFPHGPASRDARNKIGGAGSQYFSVQCGVFSKESSARELSQRLNGQGISAAAWRESRDGRAQYVVRSGQFRTYAEAEQALGRVRQHVRDAFIIP